MNAIQKYIFQIGITLALFAIIATGLVVITEASTRDKIADNERQALLNAINIIVPSDQYDNDILQDTKTLTATEQLATENDTTLYRARLNNQDKAVIFTTIAPNGYSGKITLLVGIYNTGELAGVRVISHKETPGLGDKIDANKSDWITHFTGLSLQSPTANNWAVKKDGGHFDQFTGATITPRAVVTAVKNALDYFQQHQTELFQ